MHFVKDYNVYAPTLLMRTSTKIRDSMVRLCLESANHKTLDQKDRTVMAAAVAPITEATIA